MFPFNLRGPEFLVLYWITSACVLAALAVWRYHRAAEPQPPDLVSDPYLLARLRADRVEVVRVALVALISEGAVTVNDDDDKLRARAGDARRRRPPIETELLALLRTPRSFDELCDQQAGRAICDRLRRELESRGYLLDWRQRLWNTLPVVVATTFLALLAGIKIVVAVQSGHTNVGFLILSALVATVLASRLRRPRLPPAGQAALTGARGLLERALERALCDGAPARGAELALVAAAFGTATLTADLYPFVSALKAVRVDEPLSGSGWSFLSLDGSGSGDSGGGSCGSGCGGGGGGCGGCGS